MHFVIAGWEMGVRRAHHGHRHHPARPRREYLPSRFPQGGGLSSRRYRVSRMSIMAGALAGRYEPEMGRVAKGHIAGGRASSNACRASSNRSAGGSGPRIVKTNDVLLS